MICISHANCADGFCAAFLLWLATGGKGVTYIEAKYGDPLPDYSGWKDEDVIIVDFSYRRGLLIELNAAVKSLVVLDHHATAAADLAGLDFCTFDMSRSGCRMMWDWLWNQTWMREDLKDWNLLVDYVEDRDLWKWKLPRSREVSAAIASYERGFGTWASFDIHKLGVEGVAILRYQKQLVEQSVRAAQDLQIWDSVQGRYWPCKSVNSGVLQSEIGEALCSETVVADTWCINGSGERIHSLRSRGDLDVSVIAKQFGGGGHKNAAGYKD